MPEQDQDRGKQQRDAAGAAERLVRDLREAGAAGVGQSSWGPAVYAVTDESSEGRLVETATALVGPAGHVYSGPFAAQGARVWRTRAGEVMHQGQ